MIETAGRTAVVTGAASGIGFALALHAARAGMAVAACDRDAGGLARLEAALADIGGSHIVRQLDVIDAAAMVSFAEAVAGSLPGVALLFANAGILHTGSLLAMPVAEWRLMLDVNVVGTIATVQAFAPAMVARAEAAQIVITGSTGSMLPGANLTAYCATKHALWPVAEALADELAESAVGVSLLMPGAVATRIFAATDPDRAAPADSITPDVAAALAFEGAVAGQAKILTHPAYVERFRQRFDRVLDEVAQS
ncbi:SDR family NAD(P)-dependent oxidoreductase [Sphingomonas jatrophae]|uniref:NADP-dependent 3-hydroxy acid dehydrogenase YdfG n=1 Tax=Sphingomonas jatrophae TaxID=1166337 RepID=A0A1I6M5E0_9SPHN|nr:SDR family oxidoreductase [Sphingomonas jatrophae]SFS10732.1 NADP-dependent 3-hydroxy acid dehydrogenase YdfG [Sphingomonas jatrophae]